MCSQLQPYGFGGFHFALAHVLALTGAFFACLLVSAYMYEGLATGVHDGEGHRIEAVSVCPLHLEGNGCRGSVAALFIIQFVGKSRGLWT